MVSNGLAQTFLAVQRDAWDVQVPDEGLLARRIGECADQARERWPGVALDDELFAAHLAACSPDQTDPLLSIDALHTDDLFLACACARGDSKAILHFEKTVLPDANPAIARIDASPTFVEEALHEVRIRLLVDGEQGPARIRTYLGQGPLSNWVRVVAMRISSGLKRTRRPQSSSDTGLLDALPFDGTNPELASLRKDFSKPFRAAFEDSLAGLEKRQRNVLRLYLIEGVSAEAIGKMYGVHRATVARWISGTHQQLLSDTRRRLSAKLGVIGADLDTLMRLVGIGLEVSIVTVLQSSSSSQG